jgi:hypothetical protein
MANSYNNSQQEALRRGNAFTTNPFPTGQTLGIILKYDSNTNTCDVKTEGQKTAGRKNGSFYKNVPFQSAATGLCQAPDTSIPVIVDFSLGFPRIVGSQPKGASPSNIPTTAPTFSTISSGNVSEGSGSDSTTSYYPKGMVPGDLALVSPDGNYLAALRGKISKLYGSERAQIMVLGYHDLVRVVSENYENFSSFGELRVTNNNGRSNCSFRGGPDQVSQTGGAQKNWTFHVDIGDVGKMFDMRVTTNDNKLMSQALFSSDGGVEFYGAKSFGTFTAGSASHFVGGDQTYRYEGTVSTFVAGSHYVVCEGSQDQTFSGSQATTIGVDCVELVNRDKVLNIGGMFKQVLTGGSPKDALPTNVAYESHIVNGNATFIVGDPRDGSIPSALPGFNIFAYNGTIVLGENCRDLASPPAIQCAVALNTTLPNSIGLGCVPAGPWISPDASGKNPSTDFAMLFLKWQALMTQLITLLDSHTHSTAWGPSGPAMAPAPGGFNSTITSLITPVKSIRVAIGA